MGEIIGGIVGGLVAGLVTLLAWWGKRRAVRSHIRRLLRDELAANWEVLAMHASLGVPLGNDVVDVTHLSKQELLADILPRGQWETAAEAYRDLRSACVSKDEPGYLDIDHTKRVLEVARDTTRRALLSLGVSMPRDWAEYELRQLESVERGLMEFHRASAETKALLDGGFELLEEREAQLPEWKRDFRNLVRAYLDQGKAPHEISQIFRSESPTVAEDDLRRIEEFVLAESRLKRLKDKARNGGGDSQDAPP